MKRFLKSRLLRSGAIAAVTIAAACVIVGSGCVDRFVLHPNVDPVAAGDAQRIQIPRNGGGAIEAWIAKSLPHGGVPDAYVLAFTGNEQRAEQVAEYNARRWAPYRVETWTFNFPGYGGSTGPAKLAALPTFALDAYDALKARAGDKPIYVTSNSLGGTTALHVAAHRPTAGMIIQNPPALREVIRRQGWWNLWLIALPASMRVPDDLEAPESARKVQAPAIFITAAADNLVMPKYQQLTIDAYAGPKRLITLQHKGHNDTIDSPVEWALFQEQLQWLWNESHQ